MFRKDLFMCIKNTLYFFKYYHTLSRIQNILTNNILLRNII